MSIQPTPTTYTCPACGWSKTVSPRGDALMPGDVVEACPACGHEPLENREANAVQGALASFARKIKQALGS
jgi:predicted RNA-binding Zn-ribbon protein involved in translation (DUF1610 family)